MDILSTRSVSEMLGVSEATVKRWADAGTLRCFRTPGGHRKFRLRDVKSFLSDQQDPSDGSVTAPISTDLNAEQVEARTLALAADVDGLVSLVANHRLKGQSLASIFDSVIAPALNDLGDGWAQGRVSPAQEHIASNAVIDMIARVRPLIERTARRGPNAVERGKALCSCLGDEHHDIAVRMVALVLFSEGYQAVTCGANVPAGDLALMIAGDPPAVVALSASRSANAENLRGDLAVLASAASAAKTRIVVGGAGFHALAGVPSHVRRFGTLEELAAVAGPL